MGVARSHARRPGSARLGNSKAAIAPYATRRASMSCSGSKSEALQGRGQAIQLPALWLGKHADLVVHRRRELRGGKDPGPDLLDEIDMREQGPARVLLRVEDADLLPQFGADD